MEGEKWGRDDEKMIRKVKGKRYEKREELVGE